MCYANMACSTLLYINRPSCNEETATCHGSSSVGQSTGRQAAQTSKMCSHAVSSSSSGGGVASKFRRQHTVAWIHTFMTHNTQMLAGYMNTHLDDAYTNASRIYGYTPRWRTIHKWMYTGYMDTHLHDAYTNASWYMQRHIHWNPSSFTRAGSNPAHSDKM